mmetsp:Transcript_44091/g.42757  ORF Transcript_44091/g.42757 Transcript_44091/m.42757 type:complete len:201 (-) Transcript_44091:474-1076(-)
MVSSLMLSLSFWENSNRFFRKLAPTMVLLVCSSKESDKNSTFCFEITIVFGVTGTIGSCNSRFTVSRISLVVSTACFAVFSSVMSFGLIESTAASAFRKYGSASCSCLSASSFSTMICCRWMLQFSATTATSSPLIFAFWFSFSSSFSILSVFSVASFSFASSIFSSPFSTSTPSAASFSLSSPFRMFCSSMLSPSNLAW